MNGCQEKNSRWHYGGKLPFINSILISFKSLITKVHKTHDKEKASIPMQHINNISFSY